MLRKRWSTTEGIMGIIVPVVLAAAIFFINAHQVRDDLRFILTIRLLILSLDPFALALLVGK